MTVKTKKIRLSLNNFLNWQLLNYNIGGNNTFLSKIVYTLILSDDDVKTTQDQNPPWGDHKYVDVKNA